MFLVALEIHHTASRIGIQRALLSDMRTYSFTGSKFLSGRPVAFPSDLTNHQKEEVQRNAMKCSVLTACILGICNLSSCDGLLGSHYSSAEECSIPARPDLMMQRGSCDAPRFLTLKAVFNKGETMKSLKVAKIPALLVSVLGWHLARILLTAWTRARLRLGISSRTPERKSDVQRSLASRVRVTGRS